jgi:2-amino-4-hydroxy-6-hydroxymethyldihydropteridine diphosphokinase
MSEDVAWVPAYVGLGSNLADPAAQLRLALGALERLPRSRLVAVSGFFRNPPMGVLDQPDFVNAVAALLTRLAPRELLTAFKSIETAQGREPGTGHRWGPRIIDLDLLAYGAARIEEAGLVLPHPGIAERNFVLFPLLDVAPGLHVPGLGSVSELAARLDRKALVRVA